jgi:signal transduction histidine kinase/ActR/RegA family two-component response regulator
MNLPKPVGTYLADWLRQRCGFAYIMLDLNGRVLSWGGELDRLGIGSLTAGRPISEQLVFMEGLLPIAETALELPLVKQDLEHVWDVHLFKADGGYSLLIMDAGIDARKIEVFQQELNESALRRAGQAGPQAAGQAPSQFELIENVFFACNIAVLELTTDGKLSLVGRAPSWLTRFCPVAPDQSCQLDPDNVFSFLENFMHEAHAFWAGGKAGCLKSGLWIELDEAGKEYLFEATAIHTGRSKILAIAKEHSMLIEKQALIQKGREIELGRNCLEKSQSELKAARDDLESRVQQRTRELEQINIRLARELELRKQLEAERTEMISHLQQAQKMEAIGTLAGGIAHDFNNILSAIIGFTELSLTETPEGSQLQMNLQHVFSAGQRAKKLIRQILTFSRQSNPETQPVQFCLIMKEAIELLRASVPAIIEIRQDIQSRAYVMADPSQLHQVVMNLCTNASHAMLPDGGVLVLVLSDREIGPEDSAVYPNMLPGSYLELSVADTGHGMSPETLGRIYDPFFTTKKKGHGTGMGLSVVHGIVKNCKGDITVTSTIGQGTTFRVLLPTVKPVNEPGITIKTKLPRGSEQILFVDDEPMQIDLALKILVPLGYRVEAFTDSTTALQKFFETPDRFDLILTDMYMPRMTGRVLATRINEIRTDIPIILCSGYNDNPADSQQSNQHISGYLMKPFGMKELALTVRRILDTKS